MSDKRIALSGGIWTSLSTAVVMLAQVLRIVILTRFLGKSDFGIVSIINVVIGLCTSFADLGFASVIMYKKQLSINEFSTLFWIQMIIFYIIYGVLFLLSPLISHFYNEPILTTLIPISSLSIIFLGIGKLYDNVLLKQYKFKLLALRNIVTNILSLFLAWWLAVKGYGVYSLIYSTLFQVAIYNIWNFISGFKHLKITFVFKFKSVLPLVKMGLYQTYTHIADYFSSKLDVLIIGKFFGTETLGIYDLSKELVYKLVDFIRSVVSRVALPMLTNCNENDEMVKSRFLIVTKTVAFMCFPICITVAVFSTDIVRIMYGEKFIEAAPLVLIFSLVTLFTSIGSYFDMLGIAKGRTDLNFYNVLYRVIFTIPIIIITSLISIKAVALGHLLLAIILFVVMWKVIVKRTYPMSLKEYVRQFGRLASVMLPFGTVYYLFMQTESLNLFGDPILNVLLNGLIYVLLLALLGFAFLKKDIMFFLDMIKN